MRCEECKKLPVFHAFRQIVCEDCGVLYMVEWNGLSYCAQCSKEKCTCCGKELLRENEYTNYLHGFDVEVENIGLDIAFIQEEYLYISPLLKQIPRKQSAKLRILVDESFNIINTIRNIIRELIQEEENAES